MPSIADRIAALSAGSVGRDRGPSVPSAPPSTKEEPPIGTVSYAGPLRRAGVGVLAATWAKRHVALHADAGTTWLSTYEDAELTRLKGGRVQLDQTSSVSVANDTLEVVGSVGAATAAGGPSADRPDQRQGITVKLKAASSDEAQAWATRIGQAIEERRPHASEPQAAPEVAPQPADKPAAKPTAKPADKEAADKAADKADAPSVSSLGAAPARADEEMPAQHAPTTAPTNRVTRPRGDTTDYGEELPASSDEEEGSAPPVTAAAPPPAHASAPPAAPAAQPPAAAPASPLAAYASSIVLLYTPMTRDQLATVAKRKIVTQQEGCVPTSDQPRVTGVGG